MGDEQICGKSAVSRNKCFLICPLKAAMVCSNNLRGVCHLLPLPLPSCDVNSREAEPLL